jgi:hypothetical protein
MVGHPDMRLYLAVGEGVHPARIRHEMLERMVLPCGPPPEVDVAEKKRLAEAGRG